MSNHDTPEVPPEVVQRQKLSRAMTAETRELLGESSTIDMDSTLSRTQRRRFTDAERATMDRAEIWQGPAPLAGLTPAQIQAVKEMIFKDEPKMGMMGDRDPAYVNWIWAKHPRAAAIRYYARAGDCLPTKLPPVWPPKDDDFVIPAADAPATAIAGATAGATFTLEQVQAILAMAGKTPAAPAAPAPAPKADNLAKARAVKAAKKAAVPSTPAPAV